jgi:hypothetical protein
MTIYQRYNQDTEYESLMMDDSNTINEDGYEDEYADSGYEYDTLSNQHNMYLLKTYMNEFITAK